MANLSVGVKKFSVNFTVKNISSKKLRIFGYPIEPGRTRDLLAIPYINEDDIKSSWIKGSFILSVR